MSDRDNLDNYSISKRFLNKVKYDNARPLWKWWNGRWIKAWGLTSSNTGKLKVIEWETNQI